jgi:signal transduction histidine kinase
VPTAEKREKPLADIARLSRDLVDSMSDIVWAIDPEQDRDGVDLRLDLPAEDHDTKLGADVRRQVFLIFKESLHNAVRHSGCTVVEARMSVEAGLATLRITDNGRGFETENPARGHGLASMRARAATLDGELTVESHPGRGTIVSLRVPLAARPPRGNR